MQFKIFAIAPLAISVMAAPSRIPAADISTTDIVASSLEVRTDETATLVERQAITAAIITIATGVTTGVLTKAALAAITYAAGQVKNLKDWTKAREAFTQATVADMWAKNTDKANAPAAICYNMGYKVTVPATALAKANLKTGLLKTDYDCFYMQKASTFSYQGDGGLINYAYQLDGNVCTVDKNAKTIVCK